MAERASRRRGALLAWAAWGVALLMAVTYIALVFADRSQELHVYGYVGASALIAMAFATVGALVASRNPANAVGWVFIASGICLLAVGDGQLYAIWDTRVSPGALPGASVLAWLGGWLWIPGVELVIVLLPLLFPDGRPPSRRWGVWLRIVLGVMALQFLVAAVVTIPSEGATVGQSGQFQPLTTGTRTILLSLAVIPGPLMAVASLVSLVQTFGHSHGEARQQLKWFVFAAFVTLLGFTVSAVGSTVTQGAGRLYDVSGAIFVTSVAAIPVAAGIAILRYRLYDIDLVINRTVVYGTLAVLISAVYVGLVAGVGALIHSSGSLNLVLSLAATAIVALAFQPARARLQRLANRLVYGQQADPYAVLSGFSQSMAETYAEDDVLVRMARLLARGTAAASAEVWLRVGGELRVAASWPDASEDVPPIPITPGTEPTLPGRQAMAMVRYQDELLGALAVAKKPGDDLAPVERKLLDDLALQAGFVLRNAGLTEELKQRLVELRASRQRLVAAQDAASRRIERNLHDGAQQNLVALKIKLGLLEALAARDPDKTQQLAAELQADADETLQQLRDLARGIYPPLLADKGLGAALEAQAQKAAVPVSVEVDGIGRYPQEVEAAIYFCCLEALQNIAKYSQAARVTLGLGETGGSLHFSVRDDGIGFDAVNTPMGSGLQNMADRLDALGGSLQVDSRPGSGTTLAGAVPVATTP